MRRLWSWAFGLIAAVLIAGGLAAAPASAHLTPNSEISLDMGHSLVAAEVTAPVAEIAYARGGGAAAQGLTAPALTRDLLGHMAVTAPDGRSWRIEVRDAAIVHDAGAPDFKAHLLLRPPPGPPRAGLTLPIP